MTLCDENAYIHTVRCGQLLEDIQYGVGHLHHNHRQRRRPPARHQTSEGHPKKFPVGSLYLSSFTLKATGREKHERGLGRNRTQEVYLIHGKQATFINLETSTTSSCHTQIEPINCQEHETRMFAVLYANSVGGWIE